MEDWKDFGLQIFNPKDLEKSEWANLGFTLWKEVWASTFQQLEGSEQLYSDDFDRQDEIICLTHKDKAVALIMHRYRDLKLKAVLEDSYFRCWSELARHKLAQSGSRIVIGSNITVHPDYRKSTFGTHSIKQLIVFASLAHLRGQPDIDAITGTMRVDKGMHKLFYSAGAIPVQKNVTFHNVPVELVGFFPKIQPIVIPDSYLLIIDFLIHNRSRKNGYQKSA